MYSKSFIHKFLICIILLALFDISLLYDMTADIYKGYLKIAILVAIGCHLDIYLELSKQEELIIQAFKNDTFNETYELLSTKQMVFIISFVVLMTINLIKYWKSIRYKLKEVLYRKIQYLFLLYELI